MPHCVKAAFQVHIQHPVKILLAHPSKQAVSGNSGIVYQNINVAVFRHQSVDHFLTGSIVRHIAAVNSSASALLFYQPEGFLGLFQRAVIIHNHENILSCQLQRNGTAYPTAGSGHKGHLLYILFALPCPVLLKHPQVPPLPSPNPHICQC